MNLSPRWAAMQAEAGIGAAHRPTPGTHNAPDPVIMAYASANDYAALTHDLGFGAILAATHGEKPGVVQIRAGGVSSDVIGSQVIVALRQMASERGEGALPTVDPGRTRLRVPPLPPRG